MNTIISPEGLEEIRKAATARGWVQRGGADWLDPADDGQPWPAPGIRICWHANGKEVLLFGEKTVTYSVEMPVERFIAAIDEAYPLATEPVHAPPAEPAPDPLDTAEPPPEVTDDDVRAALTERGAVRGDDGSDRWWVWSGPGVREEVARRDSEGWRVWALGADGFCDPMPADEALAAVRLLLQLDTITETTSSHGVPVDGNGFPAGGIGWTPPETCTAASRLDEPVIVATPDFGAKVLTVTLPDGWRLDDATIERITAAFRADFQREAARLLLRAGLPEAPASGLSGDALLLEGLRRVVDELVPELKTAITTATSALGRISVVLADAGFPRELDGEVWSVHERTKMLVAARRREAADGRAARDAIAEATHTLATALDHDTEAALVLETAAEEVVRRWRNDQIEADTLRQERDAARFDLGTARANCHTALNSLTKEIAELRHERDTARTDLEMARAAREWRTAAEESRRASNAMAAKLIAAQNDNEDLRARLGHAQTSIREATDMLFDALEHDTEDALVLETAVEEVIRRWTQERTDHRHSQAVLDRATALAGTMMAELRAIDEALGYGEGSTRSEGDRVKKIGGLQGAIKELCSEIYSIRSAAKAIADIDAALDGHIRPDGDRAQSIRDLVAGRQRPESPYTARLEGVLMAKDPDLLELVRRG